MEIPRYWRQQKQRYALNGTACPQCDEKFVSARPVCTHCGHPLSALSQDEATIAVLMPAPAEKTLTAAGGD